MGLSECLLEIWKVKSMSRGFYRKQSVFNKTKQKKSKDKLISRKEILS